MLTVTFGFKSEQVEIHPSFSEPVALELGLAFFNFFAAFKPHMFMNF